MKQIILVAMAMMTIAGSAQAEVSDWDYFWGTTVSEALDPKLNGWDDFWYQCQDPDKTHWDCVGTVAAGIGFAVAAPLIAVGVVATGVGVAAGGAGVAITTAPVAGLYLTTSGSFVTVPAGGSIIGLSPLLVVAPAV